MKVKTVFNDLALEVQYAELLLRYIDENNLWGVYSIYGDIMFRLAYNNVPIDDAPAEVTAIFYNLLHWTIVDNEYYGINNLTLDELMETTIWFLDHVSTTVNTKHPIQAQYILRQLEFKYQNLRMNFFKNLFTLKITAAGHYGLMLMLCFILIKITAYKFIWIFIFLFGYLVVKNLIESYTVLRVSND